MARTKPARTSSAPEPITDERSWARYIHDDRWHGVTIIDRGAVFTECSGSMEECDAEFETRPALVDCCVACVARRAQRRLIEMGLAELVANTEEVSRG